MQRENLRNQAEQFRLARHEDGTDAMPECLFEPQGRKIYLHDPRAMDELQDTISPGGSRPRKYTWESKQIDGGEASQNQKMLVRPLKKDQVFYFHVDFQNLSSEELALILYVLSPSERFRHKLGLGKPLGLGTVRIEPLGVFLLDRTERYTRSKGILKAAQEKRRYDIVVPRLADEAGTCDTSMALPPRYLAEELALKDVLDGATDAGLWNFRQFWSGLSRYDVAGPIRCAIELLGDPINVPSNALINYPFNTDRELKLYEWFQPRFWQTGSEEFRYLKPIK